MNTIIICLVVVISAPLHAEKSGLVLLQRVAIAENPRLRALEAETMMMRRRIPRSDALDDPKVKLGVNNLPAGSFSFSKEPMTSGEIGVSQMIPLGKLPYRKKIARGEYEKSLLRLKAEKVGTLHMLRVNYYELLYVTSSLKILDEIKKRLQLVIEREIAAAKAGTGALANVIKAEIEYAMIDEEITIFNQRKKEFEEGIRYLMGVQTEIKVEPLPGPPFHGGDDDRSQTPDRLAGEAQVVFILDPGVPQVDTLARLV